LSEPPARGPVGADPSRPATLEKIDDLFDRPAGV